MILEYRGGGWNRVHFPQRGSLVVYPDGLVNILDQNGRCVDAPAGDVHSIWSDEDQFFAERPECRDGGDISQDEQVKVVIYFPDINLRLGAARNDVADAFNAVIELYGQQKAIQKNPPKGIDRRHEGVLSR